MRKSGVFTASAWTALAMGLFSGSSAQAGTYSKATYSGSTYSAVFEFLKQTSTATRKGLLVTAPHGEFDNNTREIALDVCEQIDSECMVVMAGQDSGVRLNVNRPTEGARNACEDETLSMNGRTVFSIYHQQVVKRILRDGMRVYVEIHGNARPIRSGTKGKIQVSTNKLTSNQISAIKSVFDRMKDDVPGFQDVDVLVEPIDDVPLDGDCSKQIGLMATPRKSVHIELSKELRSSAMRGDTADYLSLSLKSIYPLLD